MDSRKPSKRKVREGIVISNKMEKTVTVRVESREQHPDFRKSVIRGKKYYAHNENLSLTVGSKVRIVETKPLSKLKRWRVVEVVA